LPSSLSKHTSGRRTEVNDEFEIISESLTESDVTESAGATERSAAEAKRLGTKVKFEQRSEERRL